MDNQTFHKRLVKLSELESINQDQFLVMLDFIDDTDMHQLVLDFGYMVMYPEYNLMLSDDILFCSEPEFLKTLDLCL